VLVDSSLPGVRAGLAAELATAAARSSSPWRAAELQLERAGVLAGHDPDAAFAALLTARAGGIGPDETIAAMQRASALGADRNRLRAAAETAALPEHDRIALQNDLRRAFVHDREMYDVLEQHVLIAIESARASGARAFLLGYPFSMPEHETCMQRAAAAGSVPLVSIAGAFADKVAADGRDRWFIDDIHCTAAGYAEMARVVAESLRDELR
jgi:hypothetical protein